MPNYYAKTNFGLRCWEVSKNSETKKNPFGRHISLDSEPQLRLVWSSLFVVFLSGPVVWHVWERARNSTTRVLLCVDFFAKFSFCAPFQTIIRKAIRINYQPSGGLIAQFCDKFLYIWQFNSLNYIILLQTAFKVRKAVSVTVIDKSLGE